MRLFCYLTKNAKLNCWVQLYSILWSREIIKPQVTVSPPCFWMKFVILALTKKRFWKIKHAYFFWWLLAATRFVLYDYMTTKNKPCRWLVLSLNMVLTIWKSLAVCIWIKLEKQKYKYSKKKDRKTQIPNQVWKYNFWSRFLIRQMY